MSERVVVVGSSIGGIRTGQALRAGGFDGDIVVVGAEDVDPYDKPPLSKDFLSGAKSASQIRLLDDAGWAGAGFTPVLGHPATGLDTESREVTLGSGQRIGYDRLVIATGARPRRLSDTAGDPTGHTVRDLEDSQALHSAMRRGGHVVVIGGGFIGCEVAVTARQLGCAATIVDTAPVPLARAVGVEFGRLIAAAHAEAGTTMLTDAVVDTVRPHGPDGARVTLTDGRVLNADVLVAGIGVTPNSEWLASSAVRLDDGVRTDEFCRVLGAADVYAIGDVANWYDISAARPRRVGHWTNAVDQANIVAHNIVHPDEPREYRAAPYFWSDQYGRKIQMVGHAGPTHAVEVREFEVAGRRAWAAVFSRQGRLTAAVTLGWPRAMAVLRRMWLQQAGADAALAELEALTPNRSAHDGHDRVLS
jgi:NADPH-dependent 2,4-dienoyl-CoA reductase/sulfur reductase-like enzyme